MSRLSNTTDAALRRLLANVCLKAVGLAINAAGAATLKTTSASTHVIDSVFYSKTSTAAMPFAVTHRAFGEPVTTADPGYVQPANTTVYYLVSFDAANNVAISQGSYAGQQIAYSTNLTKVLTGDGGYPQEPSGYTAVGVVKVVTGATTFTPGTTLLDAANVTATYFDVARVPVALL